MSIGQPTKSIENYESDELALAILDDRMEAFKAVIDANMADFRGHKDWLLCLLFSDYNRAQASDRHKKAWSRIETAAHKYFARQILKHTVTSNADLAERYRAISDTAKDARIKLEKRTCPNLASGPLKAWLEGTQLNDATEEFTTRLDVELNLDRNIAKATQSLAELETHAKQAADEVRRGAGRPEGTSMLPRNYISTLEKIYEESTGQIASVEAGRCREFVEAFLVGVGNSDETSKDYVAERIKYERKRTRKLSASSRQSANDRSRE